MMGVCVWGGAVQRVFVDSNFLFFNSGIFLCDETNYLLVITWSVLRKYLGMIFTSLMVYTEHLESL